MKIVKNPKRETVYIKTSLGSIQIQEAIDWDKKRVVIFKIKKNNNPKIVLEGIGTTITVLRETK